MNDIDNKDVLELFPIRGMKAKMYLPQRKSQWIQKQVGVYNSRKDLSSIRDYIPNNPVVIDVGANIGSTVMWWLCYAGASKVIAFEPDSRVYPILCKTVEINGLEDKVTVVNACVGAKAGKAAYRYYKADAPNLSMFKPADKEADGIVQMTTLDSLLDEDTPHVDLLKIDVEGSELDVLKGGEKLITRDHPLIFIEIWRPFKRHLYPDMTTSTNNYYGVVEKLKELGYVRWKDVEGINYLYVPKEKALEYDAILHPEIPQTYNEKIRYIARHGYDPLMTRLADKYKVREWVAEKIGEKYLTPLYGTWYSADEIDFGTLPSSFVLKTNHGCGYNIFVKDKSTADIRNIRNTINKWLSENYAYRHDELQYRDIKRIVFAEEYMAIDKGSQLYNYNFHCFKGKCSYIGVTTKPQDAHHDVRLVYMSRDWVPTLFQNAAHPRPADIPERPDNLDDMIRVAETLAEGFEFVRVDLYNLGNKVIRFGEMTFTPGAGYFKIEPAKFRLEIGDMFDCTPDNRIP